MLLFAVMSVGSPTTSVLAERNIYTVDNSPMLETLMEKATSFILARHYQMGGSQYAYTWALTDESDHGPANMPAWVNDPVFLPGSQMVRVELTKKGNKVNVSETVLIDSPDGVVRDPEVSTDGNRLLFSWKKDVRDEFHLYEMNLQNKEITQLTFGAGAADIEPKYLPDGRIIFCSTRCVQTVDCWYTSPANIFVCDADGSNIIRTTYDQVSLTYPTVTSDGRVLYTRWEYNDKSALYAQGIFQMNPDGTNQTEVYGNNKSFITSLLHTREIPGNSGKYMAIAAGHHTKQAGKLVIVDINKGRNSKDAITFINKDEDCLLINEVDEYGQKGALYKYPYPITEDLFLVSHAPNGWDQSYYQTPFGIYLMNTAGEGVELIPSGEYPSSQIVPIMNRILFNRASTVDYTKDSGIYYVSDVYQGEAMKGIERGTVKSLRVVSLTYRAYSIGGNEAFGSGTSSMFSPISTGNGAWDVKTVLGVVPVEEDGSAMFRVPSETPVYFQLLDAQGCVVQTMRSWSTLMPNELYSCVGCHNDKNSTPDASATVTMAMQKGVQDLKPDVWQDESDLNSKTGFDYLSEIQPILDSSCVRCHTDTGEAYDRINMQLQTKQKYSDDPGTPVSLKGDTLVGDREKKAYPLSYLVLTQSWLTFNDYYYWTARPEKNYLTTWYAAESRVELFKPYTYGSHNSKLIQMLRSGHGKLTEKQICAIEAWIDLSVPAFGSYDRNAVWDDDDRRKAEEETNKRNYYNMLDQVAKRARANVSVDVEVSVSYIASNGSKFSTKGKEMAILNVPQQLSAGDKVTVTLPKGERYLMFTLSSRMGEALVYVPDGVFTYTVPDLTQAYPTRVSIYGSNNIVARVPTDDELAEYRNLALNPYDAANSNAAYPHVTASTTRSGGEYYEARNAIDGFTANGGSGKYPCQAWEAESSGNATFKVDFGRTVTIDRMDIRIRADKGDAKVAQVVLEFDNGQKQTVTLSQSLDMQTIRFEKTNAKSVTIRDIQLSGSGKLAISEVQFFGTESK